MLTVLRNSLLLILAMVVAAVMLQDKSGVLSEFVHFARSELSASPERTSQPSPDSPTEDYASSEPNELVLEAGRWGHFLLNAEVGGREIEFLVDTGASMIALSQEDADTIGYPVHQLNYSGIANTANGTARVAPIMIDEITVGDNVIRNVRGVVIEGHNGNSLLGMTFLRKLDSFEIKNDRLILRW